MVLTIFFFGCCVDSTRKPRFAFGLSLQDCTWVENALVSPFTGLLSVNSCRKSFFEKLQHQEYRCSPAFVAMIIGQTVAFSSGPRLSFLEELDAVAESFLLSASALGRVSSLLLKDLCWKALVEAPVG